MKLFTPCMGGLALIWPLLLQAQTGVLTDKQTTIKLTPPVGVHLGSWLTHNHPEVAGRMYTPGLTWLQKSAADQQNKEKQSLLQDIEVWGNRYPSSSKQLAALRELLLAMPVTGRQKLFLKDPWLMQAHPQWAPITQSGDDIVASMRPDRVRVITADAQTCDVHFEPSRWPIDYLKACGNSQFDDVWLIQPDGQSSHLPIGAWNAQTQESPAPGAWLWVASTVASPELNRRVVQYLSTQGVAHGASPVLRLPTIQSHAPQSLPNSLNDWGMTGLLQTPSARSARAGQVAFTVNRVWPYTYFSLSLSPFDAVEVGMRYTNISNRLYGESIAGDQSYKDKSSEIKWRIVEEAASYPAIAIGLRDPGGTGLFAGEYVVASKRWQDFDMSLGIGWGYLGSRQNLPNPLQILGQRFASRRSSEVGVGGTAQTSPLLTGRTALFGGVQWQTPIKELMLKLELDGNNYQHEPMTNNVGGARSPLNWGLAWQRGPVGVSMGVERGRRWMLGLSLSTDLSQASRSKSSEPQPWPVNKPPTPTPTQSAAFSSKISPLKAAKEALTQQTGWAVQDIREEPDRWVIELDPVQGYSMPERIDRGMAVAHELAPEEIRTFYFVLMHEGVSVSSRVIDRASWAEARFAWRGQAPLHASDYAPVQPRMAFPGPQARGPHMPTAQLNLGYQQHLGGPDGYLYAFNANVKGKWSLWRGAWADAKVNMRLADNYDNFQYTAPSNLPRVRTYIREYLTDQRFTLNNAHLTQLNQWRDDVYSLVYAGALESMFAGVGGEVMWRPHSSPWAIGADINRLSQRDFDQRLSLRDYRVNSGHLTAYWDTRWQGLEAKLMVGKYLAGDRGATLEMSRRFNNGARMGAWVTKTNVSAETFGEGSFDKGVFFSLPFDALLTSWSTQTMKFAWQPLIRDGGARLNKTHTLWDLTNSRDEREWMRTNKP